MPSFDIVENFVRLIPVKDTTTGEDIFKALPTIMADMKLDFSKLTGVTTNDALIMVGPKIGVVSLLER